MGNRVDLEQNSEEWMDWRNNGIGASDVASFFDDSYKPFKTEEELFKEKVTGKSTFDGNDCTRRGQELEPVARIYAEKTIGKMFHPYCFSHPEYPFMHASLDGISLDNEVLEIKVPYFPWRKNGPVGGHKLALSGRIPEKYFPQLQTQLLVSGAESGYYLSFDGRGGVILPYGRDEKLIDQILAKSIAFWERCQKEKDRIKDINLAGTLLTNISVSREDSVSCVGGALSYPVTRSASCTFS